jgi:hypothetical protein
MRKFFLLFSFLFLSTIFYSQTAGTLTVTTTTSEVGGRYKPKNIVAIWIEDGANNFVRTVLAYAQTRKQYLTGWKNATTHAGTPYNIVDAISGATRTSHAYRSCTWNATNLNNQIVQDGIYEIHMEITDQNATGRSASFTFVKGLNSVTLNPADFPSFSGVTISWQPSTSSVADDLTDLITIYPNPVTSKTYISGPDIKSIMLLTLKGKIVLTTKSNTIEMANLPAGVYIAKIETGKGTILKKVLKL